MNNFSPYIELTLNISIFATVYDIINKTWSVCCLKN